MVTYGPSNTPGWTVIGGRVEGDTVADMPPGIWQVRWHRTGETIRMSDPISGKQLTLDLTEIVAEEGKVTFVVREVSNGVYLFALPGIR